MTSGSLLVPITALRRATGSQRPERRVASLGELAVAGSVVSPDSVVEVDVVLSSLDGGVEVAGTVRAPWTAECRRCLRPVSDELVAEVREIYRPAPAPARSSQHPPAGRGADAKADPAGDDEDSYALGADHLDLAPLARDAVLLNLPLAPLCRDDCPGLCPVCGAERADSDCGCGRVRRDPRWAALDALDALGGADAGSTT